MNTVGRESPTRALLESGYIDEDYRDEYINFYAKTYRELPLRCERLHFFKGIEEYLGYIVLRPIIGRPVCRTMLRPPARLDAHVSCTATYSTTPWGVNGHRFLPTGGHRFSPPAAIFSPHWRPRFSPPAGRARQARGLTPLPAVA